MNLTAKFRNATYSIRDELLPIDTWLILTEKDKPSSPKGNEEENNNSVKITTGKQVEQQQQAILDSLSISSEQQTNLTITTSTTTSASAVNNNSKGSIMDYTTQLHQLCAMSSSNLDMIQM